MKGLDDPGVLEAADPSGILAAFLRLPEQLERSYAAARGLDLDHASPRSVTFCGMGGSAVGGDVAAAALAGHLPVPAASVRGYRLPAYCGPEDLVVCLSFSGNTEETLACFDQALARGARVLAVTSGGALADRARAARAPVLSASTDAPMPRAGLGALAGAAIGGLVAVGVLPSLDEEIVKAAETLATMAESLGPTDASNEAIEIAAAVGSHVPVIWGSEGIAEPAAFRWKAAFNENAKIPAFASALPELTHHEVEGWSGDRGRGFVVLVLRHEGEHASLARGLEATLAEVEESGLGWREVQARGSGPLARMLSLILLGDTASAYHALARGIDPTPIDAIERVKRRFSEDGS